MQLVRVPEWNPIWRDAGAKYAIFSVEDFAPNAKLPPGYREALIAAVEAGTAQLIPPSEARAGR